MDIPTGLLGQATPIGLLLSLVGLFVWAFMSGRITSGKRADRELDRLREQWEAEKRDLIKQSDDRLRDARESSQYWREAHHTSEEIRANVAAQMETLRINSEVAVRVLTALPGVLSIPAAIDGSEHHGQ